MDSQEKNKHTYKLSSSVNGDVVEFVIAGKYTMHSAEKIRKEVHGIVRSMNAKKLLCDIRDYDGNFDYAETYFLATNVHSYFHNIHTALVHVPNYAHLHSFHEYFTRMNGISMKWFYNPDDAREWLKSL